MKVLILLAAFFAVACAINPAAIYRSKCSEGASYWCQSAQHADECGAVDYCIQNAWRGKIVQESEICQDCEVFANAMDNILKQTSVQSEILDGAKMACSAMESLADLCKSLVEELGPEVLQNLVIGLSDGEVCKVLQFCQEERSLQNDVNDSELCTLCDDLMAEGNALVSNVQLQQEVENIILQICPYLTPILPNCAQEVQEQFPAVIQYILAYLNPESCTLIGLCPGTLEYNNLVRQVRKLIKREGVDLCSECMSTMGMVDSLLSNAAIQEAVRLELDQLCYTLGPAAPVCLFVVNTYTKQIISALATYLNPNTFCTEFKFCPSEEHDVRYEVDFCSDCTTFIGDLDGLLTNQTVQSMLITDIDNICALLGDFAGPCKSYVDQYAYIVFDTLASVLSPQEICTDLSFCSSSQPRQTKRLSLLGDDCTDCKAFFADVSGLLLNQTVENMLTNDILLLCNDLGSYADECTSLVNQYAPIVYPLLASYLKPSVDNPELCTMCEEVVSSLETYIASQTNQALIVQELDSLVCANLGPFSTTCKSLVKTYTPIVINLVLSYAKPVTMCTEIKLCPGESTLQIPADPKICADCEAFLGDIDAMLGNQTFQNEVTAQLEGLCSMAGSLEAECKLLIETYAPTIFALIMAQLDPTTDCTDLGLCPGMSLPKISAADPQLCSDCKNFLTEIDAFLSNQTFQKEVITELGNLCSLAGSLQAECKLLVATYGPAAFSYLLSELDPTTACTEIGVCPGLSSPVLTQRQIALVPAIQPMVSLESAKPLPQKQTPIKLGDSNCDFCKLIVGTFLPYVESNATESEVLDAVAELCSLLPSAELSQECHNMVEVYGSLIFELLKSEVTPEAICQTIGECSSLMTSKPIKHLKQVLSRLPLKDDTLCTLCEIGIGELETILESNKSKEEITQEVEKLICSNLPSPLNTQCISFMNIYGNVLVQLLIEQLEPSSFCAEIGLCSSQKKPVLKYEKKPLQDSTECALCEFIVSQLDSALEQNSTEEEIIQAVESVCSFLPSTIKTECDSLIETYGDDIIKYLVNEFEPSALCKAIGLCSSDSEKKPLQASTECILCEFIINELDQKLEDNSTEAEIEKAVLSVCADLPSTIKAECDSLIKEYGQDIIKYLVNEFEPSALCKAIGLCSAGEVVVLSKGTPSTNCVLCEYIMSELDKIITENSTEEEIEMALEKVCSLLPSTLTEECDAFVTNYTPFLISFLNQELDPTTFCTLIGECQGKALRKSPSKALPKAKKSVTESSCVLCEFVMSELDKLLEENSTEAEIKSALDKVCSQLPSSVTAECELFVSEYEGKLIDLLANESTKVICTDLGLCNVFKAVHVRVMGTIECDLCQTAVREFMNAIQEPSVTKEIVIIVNDTCGILPDTLKAECYMYVSQYGDLVTQFIAQFFDPITSCTLLDACPYPDNSPKKVLLGQHECTRGPGYWCASMENAKYCNMVDHCKRHAWN